jgi:hypothetical protein
LTHDFIYPHPTSCLAREKPLTRIGVVYTIYGLNHTHTNDQTPMSFDDELDPKNGDEAEADDGAIADVSIDDEEFEDEAAEGGDLDADVDDDEGA